MLTILLTCALLPQEGPVAAARGLFARYESADAVAAVEARLADLGDGRLRHVRPPDFLLRLRAAGLGSLELAERILPHGDAPLGVPELCDSAVALWSGAAPTGSAPAALDLRGFEQVCEHAFRDLTKALGSGRELDKEAPRLHGAVEELRRSLQSLGDLTRADQGELEERFERAESVDTTEILRLGRQIVLAALALDRPELLAELRRQPTRSPRGPRGVTGDVLVDRDTGIGRFVVGGFGRNTYDASQIEVIVDLGGDDEYRGPAGGAGELRRMAVVVDLAGDDTYDALDDGLGSATFGLGVLVDLVGDDRYRCRHRGMGFGAAGVGIFVDRAGHDRSELGDQCAGVGLAGVGLCLDLDGDDEAKAGLQSFGCGLPGGLGLFVDLRGNDRRALGAETKNVSDDGQDQVSVGFGAGLGLPPLFSGGLGVFVDGAGDDKDRAAGLAFGSGVRGGGGVYLDRAGDDDRKGGVASLGAAYADGIGACIDVNGRDSYQGRQLSLGAAEASGLAWFLDRGGDDRYAVFAPGLGQARDGAVAVFIDFAGVDRLHKVGGGPDWRVGNVAPRGATAVALFLDDGGSEDGYDWVGLTAPTNRSTGMLDFGKPPRRELVILVDR